MKNERTVQTMELFEFLPKPKGDKKVLRELTKRERTAVVPLNFTFVQNVEQMQACVRAIATARKFVFDLETTGVDWVDWSVCIGIAVRVNAKQVRAWIIPTSMQYAARNFTPAEIRDTFREFFEDTGITKVGHNIKFDMHKLYNTYGIETLGPIEDVMVAQHLLNENERHGLAAIAKNWLKIDSWKFKQDGHFNVWPLKMATTYLGSDCELTLRVHEWQNCEAEGTFPVLPELAKLYYEVELPNVEIAYGMEQAGIGWDGEYFEKVVKPEVQSKRSAAKLRVQEVIGPVNLDSPSQVANAFFNGLGLDRIDGNSLDKKVLRKLRDSHPVIAHFEEYRKYSTLDRMFVNELPLHVVNGRIHPSFRTLGTKTGRYSCSKPNLQQLPKASIGPLIRRAFIPSPGCVLVTMDYGQIELRWLAELSDDERLKAAFDSGEDIHSATCVMMFPGQVTMEMLKLNKDHPLRVRAKTINFGILYGMGPGLLMDTINAQISDMSQWVTLDDCKALIALWFATFPNVKKYVNRMKALVYRQGFVTTVLGRKRRLPDAKLDDRIKSSMAERQAVNAPIQGSAADMLKVASIKIRSFLRKTHYPFTLLLAIHDELLMEVPTEWLRHHPGSLNEIRDVMASAMQLRVPVVVSVDTLSRWGDKVLDDELELKEVV
jgi:DNA polymerase-1